MNTLMETNTIDALQGKAKTDLINEILERANMYLKGSQLMDLNRILNECFAGYEIFIDNTISQDENYNETNKNILDSFISTKKIEGTSSRTRTYYFTTVIKLLEWADCPLADIDTDEIREYLNHAQSLHNCSNVTLDNVRRVLSTFFAYCLDEGYIRFNPMRRIKKIKSTKQVKKAFTDDEIEMMREYFSRMPRNTTYNKLLKLRDRAIFELLLSSGIRIAECVNLNKDDLDLNSKSFKVLGKGNKERICYFSSKAKYHLEKLLEFPVPKKYARYDNPALFISYRTGGRMGINAIERRFRGIGQDLNIKIHPHKFRRTFATNLIRKEVPIEQVKELMGHNNMDTTMIYTVLDQEQIKVNHNKYAG